MTAETIREVFMRHRMSTVISRELIRNVVVTRTRCVGCGHETEDTLERGEHLVVELERWVSERAQCESSEAPLQETAHHPAGSAEAV